MEKYVRELMKKAKLHFVFNSEGIFYMYQCLQSIHEAITANVDHVYDPYDYDENMQILDDAVYAVKKNIKIIRQNRTGLVVTMAEIQQREVERMLQSAENIAGTAAQRDQDIEDILRKDCARFQEMIFLTEIDDNSHLQEHQTVLLKDRDIIASKPCSDKNYESLLNTLNDFVNDNDAIECCLPQYDIAEFVPKRKPLTFVVCVPDDKPKKAPKSKLEKKQAELKKREKKVKKIKRYLLEMRDSYEALLREKQCKTTDSSTESSVISNDWTAAEREARFLELVNSMEEEED